MLTLYNTPRVESFIFLIIKNQPNAVSPYIIAPKISICQPEKAFCNEACFIRESARTVIKLNPIPIKNATNIVFIINE